MITLYNIRNTANPETLEIITRKFKLIEDNRSDLHMTVTVLADPDGILEIAVDFAEQYLGISNGKLKLEPTKNKG